MKIRKVEGFHLKAKLQRPAGNSKAFMASRQGFVVRITADDSSIGWGEGGPAPDGTSAYLKRVIAPRLIGQDASNVNRIWHMLMGSRGYDVQGCAMMAISAVDIALHDLLARANDMSIADMAGGAISQDFFAYGSGPYLVQDDDLYAGFRDEMEAMAKEGFGAIKPRVGGSNARTAQFLTAVRGDLGADFALMIDMNGGYSIPDAKDMLARTEAIDLIWAEEPVSQEDFAGHGHVGQSTRTPIASGESLATLGDFERLMVSAQIGVLQPDLTVCGGYTGMRKVVALAETHHVPVAPHIWGTAIGFYAALQMVATLSGTISRKAPELPWVELERGENPLMEIFGRIAPDANGRVTLPEGPGFGVTPELTHIDRWIDDSWSVTA